MGESYLVGEAGSQSAMWTCPHTVKKTLDGLRLDGHREETSIVGLEACFPFQKNRRSPIE